MNFSEFVVRLDLWPRMHFTAIESEQYVSTTEIYAVDSTGQTKSRLLLLRTPDAQQAAEMATNYRVWLEKYNRGRMTRKPINERTVARMPCPCRPGAMAHKCPGHPPCRAAC